jgi:hypothetical protein
VARAITDLTFPLVVVEYSGPVKTVPVLYSVVDTIRLALDCCYANISGAQADTAEKIYLSILPYFKEIPGTRQLKYNISNEAGGGEVLTASGNRQNFVKEWGYQTSSSYYRYYRKLCGNEETI